MKNYNHSYVKSIVFKPCQSQAVYTDYVFVHKSSHKGSLKHKFTLYATSFLLRKNYLLI